MKSREGKVSLDTDPLLEQPPKGRPLAWYQSVIAALDFETTGPNPQKDRPVQVAFTLSDSTGLFALNGSWQTIVNPGMPIEEGAAKVHGITQERVDAEGVSETEAFRELLYRLEACFMMGFPLVIFNAPFDWTMLHRRVEELLPGSQIPVLTILDPLVIDKRFKKYRRSGERKLEPLCSEAGVWMGGAHDAWFDCLGAVALLRSQVTRQYKEIASWPLESIAKALPGWHQDWAQGYNRWRSKQNMEPIKTEWPLLPKEG